MDIPHPLNIEGPLVHGKATRLKPISFAQMQDTFFAQKLIDFLNICFGMDETLFDRVRFLSVEQFHHEMANDTFLYGLFWETESAEDPGLIATIGARHVQPKKLSSATNGEMPEELWSEEDAVFKYSKPTTVEPGEFEWTVATLCVSPEARRLGLARYMLKIVESEVLRLFKLYKSAQGLKVCRVVLSTLAEHNETFYPKVGYTLSAAFSHPKGTINCGRAFTVMWFEKRLDSLDKGVSVADAEREVE